jgi:8-hydroxy-5-deazaflavin:NADPH oxidoreductase
VLSRAAAVSPSCSHPRICQDPAIPTTHPTYASLRKELEQWKLASGAGQIGGTLTRRLTALGHQVVVANSRGPETLSDLAAETGATAVSVPEAVRGVDLVVVTIPEKNISDLPPGLFAATPDRVVVIDTGNYYPRQRDGRIEAIEAGLPESQWVAQQLGRPVIKAFNNIYARHLLELGRPKGAAGRIALPVAGDDAAAKAIVLKLVDELGFDAVDAGGLDELRWRSSTASSSAYIAAAKRARRESIARSSALRSVPTACGP